MSGNVLSNYTGFESNMNKISLSVNIIKNKVDNSFNKLSEYLENVETFTDNEAFYDVRFLNVINSFLQMKSLYQMEIISNLKVVLKNIYYVKNREKSFDLFMDSSYSELIQFLASQDLSKDSSELDDQFQDFVGQKNMMFFEVKKMFDLMRNLTRLVINIFDFTEKFVLEAKYEKSGSEKLLTIQDLRRYEFILGLIYQYKEFQNDFNEIMEKYEQNNASWEEQVEKFDDTLEDLKLMYLKRFVEGEVKDDEGESNDEDDDKENDDEDEDDDLGNESNKEPIDVCDTLLLSNYFLKGEQNAFEIEKYDEIDECENIKKSCCSREEIENIFNKFTNSNLSQIRKKYQIIFDILKFLVTNYENFTSYAFEIEDKAQQIEIDEICIKSARKLIFTPINRNFNLKFLKYAKDAFKFSINSKNSLYCQICDYGFHKTFLEDKKINLSKEFCEQMIEDTFEFTSIYHLQLIDYFNNLINTLQCDINSGQKREEIQLIFNENQELLEMLLRCEDNDREDCFEYCQNFFFTGFQSIFDIPHEELLQLYKFMIHKSKILNLKIDVKINENTLRILNTDIYLEQNQMGPKSIDKIRREIIETNENEDSEIVSFNPNENGPEIEELDKDYDIEIERNISNDKQF